MSSAGITIPRYAKIALSLARAEDALTASPEVIIQRYTSEVGGLDELLRIRDQRIVLRQGLQWNLYALGLPAERIAEIMGGISSQTVMYGARKFQSYSSAYQQPLPQPKVTVPSNATYTLPPTIEPSIARAMFIIGDISINFRTSEVPEIIDLICKYGSIDKETLIGDSKHFPEIILRQGLQHLLRKERKLPLAHIAELTGCKEHGTVLSNVRRFADYLEVYGKYLAQIKQPRRQEEFGFVSSEGLYGSDVPEHIRKSIDLAWAFSKVDSDPLNLISDFAQHAGVNTPSLIGKRRTSPLIFYRQALQWVLTLAGYTAERVAELTGCKDYRTVSSNTCKFQDLIQVYSPRHPLLRLHKSRVPLESRISNSETQSTFTELLFK